MRYNLIDFIRGLAFLCMLIHHIYYFNPNSFGVPGYVENIGVIARSLFLILVGVSFNISNNKTICTKRNLELFLGCAFVTILTMLFLPSDNVVFFGVLHFILVATILIKPISNDIYLVIAVGFISYILSIKVKTLEATNDIFGLILGRYTISRMPLDIFPIFKWLPYVCLGVIIGSYHEMFSKELSASVCEPIEFIGRNSLYIYMLHLIPCIIWTSEKYKIAT